MILFSQPSISTLEQQYVTDALLQGKLCGDGPFTCRASSLLSQRLAGQGVLLTTSCTHALEMAALLCNLKPGDEVILPSYTFVSTANAFVMRGAKLVFCDIESDTMNLDTTQLPKLITSKTRAIVPVDYAGVSCNMDAIAETVGSRNIVVVEDAAQAVGSSYKGVPCGTLADFGCYSFHETKNYIMGEGGGITCRSPKALQQAEIIREKGTDRSLFLRGAVDKYTWRAPGSSYLPAEPLVALLCAQLERFDEIMDKRMHVWNSYHAALASLERKERVRRPIIPNYASHNAHMYYLILPTQQKRDALIAFLAAAGICAPFHYIPLHTSPMGQSLGGVHGSLPITEEYAGRLIRLPLWAEMSTEMVAEVVQAVEDGVQKG